RTNPAQKFGRDELDTDWGLDRQGLASPVDDHETGKLRVNRMADQRLLVTGASGYLGGRLLQALERSGRRVRCMARRPDLLIPRVGNETEVVYGDVLKPESLDAALDG